MNQGDIVFAPFPFADSDKSKPRPAVVIAEIQFGNSAEVILSMISTRTVLGTSDDVVIMNVDPEFKQTELKVSSCVMTGKIATISTDRIKFRLGKLGPQKHDEFVQKLKKRLVL